MKADASGGFGEFRRKYCKGYLQKHMTAEYGGYTIDIP